MTSAVTITVTSSDGKNTTQRTSLLKSGARGILSRKSLAGLSLPDDEVVSDYRLQYVYNERTKKVTVEPLNSAFGAYRKIESGYVAPGAGANSFILGDTLFTLVEDSGCFSLTYVKIGEECGMSTMKLDKKLTYMVGRAPSARAQQGLIRISGDPDISRNHCWLWYKEELGQWLVADNSSSNGVYVRLNTRYTVRWDELIRIGKRVNVYFSMDDY